MSFSCLFAWKEEWSGMLLAVSSAGNCKCLVHTSLPQAGHVLIPTEINGRLCIGFPKYGIRTRLKSFRSSLCPRTNS